MKSEEDKYLDAWKKALDFKKAYDELTKESQIRLIKEATSFAGTQHLWNNIKQVFHIK